MIIHGAYIHTLLRERYPNAEVVYLDSQYNIPKRRLAQKAYSGFQSKMWAVGLIKWTKNKLDCDDWSILFKAYCIVRNALSRSPHAIPVGRLMYNIGGDPMRPHAINFCLCVHDNGKPITIHEIEPQPRKGLTTLTKAERDTAWFAEV